MDKMERGLWDVNQRQSEQQQAAYESDVYATDEMLRRAFNTPNGRKALAYMEQIARQVGADPNLGMDRGAAWGFFREGQAQLVWEIRQRMIRAEQGPPKQQQGDEG
jgi:hypothetical protein